MKPHATLSDCVAVIHYLKRYKLEKSSRYIQIREAMRGDLLGKASRLTPDEMETLIRENADELGFDRQKSYIQIMRNIVNNKTKTSGSDMKEGCIVFIHGLGSTHEATWATMESLIRADNNLDARWDTMSFTYPTTKKSWLWNFFYGPKYLDIPDLAKALATEIDTRCKKYGSVVIIGHSMGGLVAAKYFITERPRSPLRNIKGVMFYAAPFDGSHLANIANILSRGNRQLKFMLKNSSDVRQLCEVWKEQDEIHQIPHVFIAGGQDRAVPSENFAQIFGNKNTKILVADDHSTICRPKSAEALSFIILRDFLESIN